MCFSFGGGGPLLPLHKYGTGPPSVSVEFRHSDAVACFTIVLSEDGVTIGKRLWKIVNKHCNHEKTKKNENIRSFL